MPSLRIAILAAALAAAGAFPLCAQDLYDWDVGRAQLTRPALEQLRERLDLAAESPAYSDRLRNQARLMAAAIRQRLTDGDFRVGDRVWVRVQGTGSAAQNPSQVATAIIDTIAVGPSRTLTVQGYRTMSLTGVLRSELQATVAREVAQVERGAMVEARSLIRIAVFGGVGRPGYYVMPSELLIENVFMMAGGPGQTGMMDRAKIERGRQTLWEGQLLQRAIAEGQTLDALNLQDGDVVTVPSKATRNWFTAVRTFYMILGLPAALFGISRVF